MSKSEIKEKIISMLSESTGKEIDEKQLDKNLMGELDLSSLEIMLFITDMEEEFGIEITEELLRDIVSVNDLIDVVYEEVSK